MSAKSWRSPVRRVVEVIVGQDGPGLAGARVLQTETALAINLAPGTPHFGERGGWSTTWQGWTQSPQIFQGQAQMGSITNPPVITEPALPSGKVPPALPSTAMFMNPFGGYL